MSPRIGMRAFDLFVSALGLLLLAPLLGIVALAIKLGSPGPVIHPTTRVGRNAVPFQLFKLRTMMDGSDRQGSGLTRGGDDRVTRIGGWLRRTKIDELPQLYNVLRGDMSLVGPRPEDPRYVELYTDAQRRVLSVRPGITSPASILFRNESELLIGEDWKQTYENEILPQKLSLELDYMLRATFWSNLQVILQTLRVL